MHLIRLVRESDYDLEYKIDWKYSNYESAKKKILKDLNPVQRKTTKELFNEVY